MNPVTTNHHCAENDYNKMSKAQCIRGFFYDDALYKSTLSIYHREKKTNLNNITKWQEQLWNNCGGDISQSSIAEGFCQVWTVDL